MTRMNRTISILALGLLLAGAAVPSRSRASQDPPPPPPPPQTPAPSQDPPQGQGRGGERRPGVFGKLTAIHDQSLEITRQDGSVVTIKLSGSTQFRKDREAAKLSDFKVGDTVGVRGQENQDHSWTAESVGSFAGGFGRGQGGGAGAGNGRGAGPAGGAPGAGGPGGMRQLGVLGQDYIFGEVKSIDAPKITILRPDSVTQTVELNEETSLRKGRDSVTMADIQPRDHVMVRGGMANNVFQPKSVNVISPEQWKRMQEMGIGGANGQPAKPPQPDVKPQSPPETPH